MSSISNLIAAFQIFREYGDVDYPTTCEHDIMYVNFISPEDVSPDDKQRLEALGFLEDGEVFYSTRYGSN